MPTSSTSAFTPVTATTQSSTTIATPQKIKFTAHDDNEGEKVILSPETLEFVDETREPAQAMVDSPPAPDVARAGAMIDSHPNVAQNATDPTATNVPGPATPPNNSAEQTAEQAQRAEEESIALARALMAEEAMAVSYHMSVDYLRNNRDQFSEEDLAALQAAMDDDEEPAEAEEHDESNMSYDMMLRLGEALGDVKTERWEQVAHEKINALPTFTFDPKLAEGKDENDCEVKCLVCQFSYEKGDKLRRLPCSHCFHSECVDQWLVSKDFCPYCRTAIVKEEDGKPH